MKNGGRFAAMASLSRQCHNSRRTASAGRLSSVAAFNAPDGVQIRRAQPRRIVNEPGAGFLLPGEPVLLLEFRLQLVRERLKVMRVVARVTLHALGERPPRPVGFLRPFLQLHPQIMFNQMAQAKLAMPSNRAASMVSKIAPGTNSWCLRSRRKS